MSSFFNLTNLHRFAIFTAFSTFLLIFAGGLVTSTQSGLSVPDWPTTYGHFMFAYPLDEMVGGIFYEHSHRMIASFVGFLTVILAIWIWKRDDRRWVRILGLSALGAVIPQGILGGLTVRYLLPTPISVSHAALAQTFFMMVAVIALVTSRWWRSDLPVPADSTDVAAPHLMTFAMLALGAVYIQLILGAVMRHLHAGLAVPDLPLAYGQVFPSLTPESVDRYNGILLQSEIRIAADDPVTSGQVLVHTLHRMWAIVTAGMVMWFSLRLVQRRLISRRFFILGWTQIVLVTLQIGLGVFTVISRKAVDITTLHVATGALLLVTVAISLFHVARVFGMELVKEQAFAHPREALS